MVIFIYYHYFMINITPCHEMARDIYRLLLKITGIQTIWIEITFIIVLKIMYRKSIVFRTSFINFLDYNTERIVADKFFDI